MKHWGNAYGELPQLDGIMSNDWPSNNNNSTIECKCNYKNNRFATLVVRPFTEPSLLENVSLHCKALLQPGRRQLPIGRVVTGENVPQTTRRQ